VRDDKRFLRERLARSRTRVSEFSAKRNHLSVHPSSARPASEPPVPAPSPSGKARVPVRGDRADRRIRCFTFTRPCPWIRGGVRPEPDDPLTRSCPCDARDHEPLTCPLGIPPPTGAVSATSAARSRVRGRHAPRPHQHSRPPGWQRNSGRRRLAADLEGVAPLHSWIMKGDESVLRVSHDLAVGMGARTVGGAMSVATKAGRGHESCLRWVLTWHCGTGCSAVAARRRSECHAERPRSSRAPAG
jgi:hypothetical protein